MVPVPVLVGFFNASMVFWGCLFYLFGLEAGWMVAGWRIGLEDGAGECVCMINSLLR